MYQTFDHPAAGAPTLDRLRALRARLSAARVDAFLIPRADEHQGEYVAPSAERLKWLTGFSGSAGFAAVTARKAALFVDGRYTVQARAQVDGASFEVLEVPAAKLSDWLGGALTSGGRVGFDPWLHTAAAIEQLAEALAKKQIKPKPLARNPLDQVWGRDRPPAPLGAVVPQSIEFAGRTAADKISALQKQLKADGQDAAILTLPDSIAWLFNIRGSDVAHNPVPLAFAIVPDKGRPTLFIAPGKVGANVRPHIEAVARLAGPAAFATELKKLREQERRVRLDPATAAFALKRALGPKSFRAGDDPCLLPKAIKNSAELAGARAAHLRDGVAVTRYLAWLELTAAGGKLDEITAVTKLEELRRATGSLKEISFDTISGSGPNGAIVHYRVTTASNRHLRDGELFLVDSGAQYADGTTDITRTIAIGRPSAEMRRHFTLVLKGHIAVASARFPKGTRGAEIDAMARRALWAAGLDFDHGTGHGVGSYLSVHEGPQRIAKTGMVALEPGMIVSNEPGYYKEGQYGIRIENLLVVSEPSVPAGGERAMLGFETLTLAPFDRALIAAETLTAEEREWLDGYHARVRAALHGDLDRDTRAWLARATAPLER